MSVILLSDPSGLRNSDEHRAFDLSAGRTLARLRLTPPDGQKPIPPKQLPLQPKPAAVNPAAKDDEPPREIPASSYLPVSG